MAELIVVGGSAGGLEALASIVSRLPPDFRATMLVVTHVPPDFPSRLPELLARRTELSVAHATEGERIAGGTVRIAPPDHHLAVRDGRLHLSRGPRENRHRPSIDVLFRTAAAWYGNRAVGVVLSGGPGDGLGGVRALEEAGAAVLVQHPGEALFAAMPQSILEMARSAQALTIEELTQQLITLAEQAPRSRAGVAASEGEPIREKEAWPAEMGSSARTKEGWRPASYACPDCNGVLWEKDDGELLRFRCRVGHGFAGEALLGGKSEQLEDALWSAINTMEERAELADRLQRRAEELNFHTTARRYEKTAHDMREQAEQIRQLLASTDGLRLEPVEGAGEPQT